MESYLTELYGRSPPARIKANRLFGADTLQLEWSTFDISRIYRMPRWEIPTYGRLWQSIGTVLLDATTSAARNIRSQQLSRVFLQKRIDVHSSKKTSATSLCPTGRRNAQPYCPCSFHLLPGHGELSDLVRKHALVRDGIQKHAPILDCLEFAITCLVSQILGPGVTG